jgi:phospholipase C
MMNKLVSGSALRIGRFALAAFGVTGVWLLTPSASVAAGQAGLSKIQHIVIITQEERSFDNLFAGFPGADTQSYGYISSGRRIVLQPLPFSTSFELSHSAADFERDYDGGRNDGFNKEKYYCDNQKCRGFVLPQYSYVPAADTRPYFALASQYVLGDRMFGSTYDGEFETHFQMIAAQDARTTGNPSTHPWGCDNENGLTTVDRLPPLGATFPCFDVPTVADELDPAGISWRAYVPGPDDVWLSGFDAVKHIRYGPDGANFRFATKKFEGDIARGELAGVSWIAADPSEDDLPGPGGSRGPDFVAGVVNAVGESKYWESTAIFVTWSSWGGFYDHVAPPQDAERGRSFRVPLIVVSPYVPAGKVTHEQYQHGSILKFVEEAFGLNPLTRLDARANSLEREFDFSKPARKFVPIAL